MPIQDLKAQIARLPEQPGVYLFLNRDGDTIYVGKARALRDRVRSYLGAEGTDPKTDALVDEVDRIEFTVTDSVVEALALENNLIKQRMPKFNILLRDDKTYPYLKLTVREAFPRVLLTRRLERDGEVYAGPFMPASLARRTMSLSHRLFGMRSCNEEINGRRGRPCLEYDIKRCIAPCVEALCTREQYTRAVEHARLFLEGRNEELVEELRGQMTAAAQAERFEEAAQLRDAMRTVETLRDRQQKMATTEFGDRDAFGVKVGPVGAIVFVFQMRAGRVIERVELATDVEAGGERGPRRHPTAARGAPTVFEGRVKPAGVPSDHDVVQAAVQQFYQERDIPPEIHLPVEIPEADATETWLSQRAGRRVRLLTPKRGEKRSLLDLANRNAAIGYQARFAEAVDASFEALTSLQAALALPALPRRIECFDISTIQGSETVAAMVACEDGRMRPSEYRKYRIRGLADKAAEGRQASELAQNHAERGRRGADATGAGLARPSTARDASMSSQAAGRDLRAEGERRPAEADSLEPEIEFCSDLSAEAATEKVSPGAAAKADDFAAMQEVVLRRYRLLLELGGEFPDLVLIDGGRGQVSAAYVALEALGLGNLVAVGLAKKEELLFLRDRPEPVALATSSPALLLLQRVRDEAHRFAVTFHRSARRSRDLRSELDNIPGIGPRRRRALLASFGSVAGVRRASREELMPLVGRTIADAILEYFAQKR